MTTSSRASLITLAVLSATLASGCTRRMIDFTVISGKNVALQRSAEDAAQRAEGKDQVYWLFWIPLGQPDLKEAVDRAIEAAGPQYDALIDGVVYSYNYWFVVSGMSGFKVVGTPVVSSRMKVGMPDDAPVLYHSRLGVSNQAALARLPVVQVDRNGEPIAPKAESSPGDTGR